MDEEAVDGVAGTEWPGVEKLNQAQEIMDRNKFLINEINSNHQLKTQEALARNVVLIRELNSNIQKVVATYKDLGELVAPPTSSAPAAMAPS